MTAERRELGKPTLVAVVIAGAFRGILFEHAMDVGVRDGGCMIFSQDFELLLRKSFEGALRSLNGWTSNFCVVTKVSRE